MLSPKDYMVGETAWCPGCGNFPIREALAGALSELQLPFHQVLICSGIGQAAKIPHYLKVNGFNGLHGRALPPALGAKIANKELTVIVESGDGDSYGEGGNHFIHTVRRNPDLTHLVHNNQIYGLTKGQASPTSDPGMVTGVQTTGVSIPALNPLALALVLGAGFVARCFSGEKDHLKETIKAAIEFPGYALVDILQPCLSFNKVNTFGWYKKRIYFPEIFDREDWHKALDLTREWGERISLGIFYSKPRPTFESMFEALEGGPLVFREFTAAGIVRLQNEFY